jgi:fumarate hydratase class II
VTLPLLAHNLLQSVALLSVSSALLADKCVAELVADRARCETYVENSLALVTGLVPHLGYDRAAELAKKAFKSGKTIRQVAREEKVLPEDVLDEALGK